MRTKDQTIPRALRLRFQYYIWLVITPISFYIRDILVFIKIIKHKERQEFYIGKLTSDRSPDDLKRYLEETHGFESRFLAWTDDDQVHSLRFKESFIRQYHVRIYIDGEVRGHYEYTPEGYPIAHLKEIGMENRQEDFLEILDGWLE